MTETSFEQKVLRLFAQALDQPSGSRLDWVKAQAGNNKALFDRVKTLLAEDTRDSGLLRTGGASSELGETAMPKRVGIYNIVEIVGKGGMGAVYKAVRDGDDFDMTAAIKIVRPGALSDTLIERFERERQILAGLNHPHIARLYDGGQLEDRSPYMVMEYIEGEPITVWADAQKLSMTDRLWLFGDLCRAVRHAHQNLIIHRDITPSNVMVTAEGAVKLIDFGIAKPFDSSEDSQASAASKGSLASLSFTPGYAAPERAQGAAANTLSDVFSLGKLLEELIERHTPNADLDAIVSHATANEPTERYPSVDALLEDVQNFLSGRGVAARQGGATYRIGKFIRRHKFAISAATASVLALAGGLLITTNLFYRAEAAQTQADQRFDEVRSIANYMLFDLYDQLQTVPGNTPALEDIASRSQGYLDTLSATQRGDLDLQLETIAGYHRLANVLGNPVIANLGEQQSAETMLADAETDLDGLLGIQPDNPDLLRERAKLAYSRAAFEYLGNDDSEATIALADKSLEYFERLGQQTTINLDDKLALHATVILKAQAMVWTGQSAESMSLFAEIEPDVLALLAQNPDTESVRNGAAYFYSRYAQSMSWHLYYVDGNAAQALPVATEGVERYRALIDDETTRSDYRRATALAHYRRGHVHTELKDFTAALSDYDRALDLAQRLSELDPEDKSARDLVNSIQTQRLSDLAFSGQSDNVVDLGAQIIAENRLAFEKIPDSPSALRDLANTLQVVGEALVVAGEPRTGCEYLVEAFEHIKKFDAQYGVGEVDRKTIYDPLELNDRECRQEHGPF